MPVSVRIAGVESSMSRAILKMALARAMHREPTAEELAEFLAELALRASADRIYIPQASQVSETDIRRLRREGLSIRKIARKLGCSKSHVGRALAQGDLLSESVPNSALFVDTKAA